MSRAPGKYVAGTMAPAGAALDRPDLHPSSRTMALGSTQTLMSTRNLPGGKGRPALEADKLTAICEPIV
jgi:hypothetical protein